MKKIVFVLLLTPVLAFCAPAYDDFSLFGLDAGGSALVIMVDHEDKDSPLQNQAGVVGLKATFSGVRYGQNRKDRAAFSAGHCTMQLNAPLFIDCKEGEGLLSGTYYEGKEIQADSSKNPSNLQPLIERFAKMQETREGITSYFKCTRSCSSNVPDTLIMQLEIAD